MILITIISATSKLFLEDTSLTFNVNTGSTHKMEHLMQLKTHHHRRSSLYTTFFYYFSTDYTHLNNITHSKKLLFNTSS